MEWSVKKSSVWWISNRVRQSEPQTYLKAALLPELM
jgi:phosphohistidine phosphatase